MDENLENAAQEFERKLDDAAENAWKSVKDSAEQIEGEIVDASETVQGGWNEVKDEFHKASAESWSAPEVPQTPPPPPQPETDRWGSPVNENANDPNRWDGTLYSPGADEPAAAPKVEGAPKVVDYVAASSAKPPKKESFPVWAIVLIVVLVLCLCVLCPILFIGGGVLSYFKDMSSIMPFLMI